MSLIMWPCRSYRYSLSRAGKYMFSKLETALFIVLKPGATDAILNDPTILCCRTFTRDLDRNGIRVTNLYALRSVDSSVV